MLSKDEIQVLNTARMVLLDTQKEASRLSIVDPDKGYGYGILMTTADHGQTAIFNVLNKARAYCKVEITDDEIHMRETE